jgi:hypothetical protein
MQPLSGQHLGKQSPAATNMHVTIKNGVSYVVRVEKLKSW